MFSVGNMELQERSDHLESVQRDMEAGLASSQMPKYLDEVTIGAMRAINQSLFIPNLRTGMVEIPRSYQPTEAIPFFAAPAGERYIISPSAAAMTPRQQSTLGAILNTMDDSAEFEHNGDDIAAEISKHLTQRAIENPFEVILNETMLGSVDSYSDIFHIDSVGNPDVPETSLIATGRPILVMAYNLAPAAHGTAFHEAVHVYQGLKHPGLIMKPAENVPLKHLQYRELEAHRLAALYGLGVYDSIDGPDSDLADLLGDVEIEDIRSRYADPDPAKMYEITPPMRIALRAAKIPWA